MDTKKAFPLFIFLISRALILLAISAAFFSLHHQAENPGNLRGLLEHWTRADSRWYFSIVEKGYSYVPAGRCNIVFFPLYPLLIKFFNLFFHHISLTGVIISNSCFLLALILLYKLAEQKFSGHAAIHSTLLLALFPFSFFYSTAYAESLFLLLAVLSFYLAEKNSWGMAALAGMLCSASRAAGIFLLPALILLYLEKINFNSGKIKADIYYLLAIPLGFLAYAGYLWIKFGANPIFLLHSAEMAWERSLFNFSRLNYAFGHFLADDKAGLYLFYAILTLVFLFSLRKVMRCLKSAYTVFAFCLILAPLLTSLQSMGRYLSVVFPCFIAVSYATRSKFLLYALHILSTVMLIGFSAYFILGGRLY